MPAVSTPGISSTRRRTSCQITLRLAAFAAIVVIHADRGGPARLETKIDIEDAQKTPQQQPSAHQQHAGQGNLGDDQHRAHPLMLLAVARSMA